MYVLLEASYHNQAHTLTVYSILDQGKSVEVTVTDRCTGCAETDLDFSPSAFDQLADETVGRISGMTWVWS